MDLMSNHKNSAQSSELSSPSHGAQDTSSAGSTIEATLQDVEANKPASPQLPEKPADASLIVIGWDGDDDPENPYNWPAWRTNSYAGLLSFLAFLIPLASCGYQSRPEIMLR